VKTTARGRAQTGMVVRAAPVAASSTEIAARMDGDPLGLDADRRAQEHLAGLEIDRRG
jgi:hypothetical protein